MILIKKISFYSRSMHRENILTRYKIQQKNMYNVFVIIKKRIKFQKNVKILHTDTRNILNAPRIDQLVMNCMINLLIYIPCES